MSDLIVSWIRTAVPVAVGAVLTWLASRFGVVVDEQSSAGLTVGLVALFTGLYYAVARALEHRWPVLGVLLGAPRQPTYRPPAE